MKASNHFILTRSLSAAGQIGCGLFGQSRLSLENCFRIFTKYYTEEIENLIWSAFSEFQFFITSCEFDFWIHSSSYDVFGVVLI